MSLNTKPRHVPLLWILLPYAAGIALARFLPVPTAGWLAVSTIGCLAIGYRFAEKRALIWAAALAIAMISIGALRFSSLSSTRPNSATTVPREAILSLKIETLFNATDPDTALGISRVQKAPPHQTELEGQRLFFFLDTRDLPMNLEEGETFQAIGVVRTLPGYAEGDRFDAYLRNLGIGLTYKQGNILNKVQEAQGSDAFFNSIRHFFSETLGKNNVPNSENTRAYRGLMLGEKSELTPEQKQLFLANGTMHLFAISGLHIGVIAVCFHTALSILRFGSSSRALLTLLAVAFFVLVTGGSASSWRALLMIACLYASSFGRRQSSPVNALALSALIYLTLLPGELFQAGFQMSYLTVTAILLLGLPLARTLKSLVPIYKEIPPTLLSWPQRWLLHSKNRLLDATGVSVAAFLMSALLGIYYFQILPTYGVLINLVALPLASLAIIAGFLSLLLSPLQAIAPASELFNNAALVLIGLIHRFLELTSQMPYASIHTPSVSAVWASAAILSTLGLIAVAYSSSDSKKSGLWQTIALTLSVAWIVALQG